VGAEPTIYRHNVNKQVDQQIERADQKLTRIVFLLIAALSALMSIWRLEASGTSTNLTPK
jgi:hypothetical protein